MNKIPFHTWRPHPWHGLEIGPEPPRIVNAYIELTPFDMVKYEIDKQTGYLRVDRPQRTSSQPPVLYGFIPQTMCGERLSRLSPQAKRGDGDPLDICVISERPISKSEIVLTAQVVGGLRLIDDGEADDKIIAILQNDYVWANTTTITGLPPVLTERLVHYFKTYKLVAGEAPRITTVEVYDYQHAWQAVEAAMADYREAYPKVPDRLE
jgi:inorganic pyrophosphatase